jgi:hypothetical protein
MRFVTIFDSPPWGEISMDYHKNVPEAPFRLSLMNVNCWMTLEEVEALLLEARASLHDHDEDKS